MNWKTLGDIAQNCTIGELSKYGLGIAFPLSDNYPFDIIIIANNKLFKTQVRGSSVNINGAVQFKLDKDNFYRGTSEKYAEGGIDLFALWDFKKQILHIISYNDVRDNSCITIRYDATKNNMAKRINFSEDTIISKDRIKKIFDFDVPDLTTCFSKFIPRKYKHTCVVCSCDFENAHRKSKFCSSSCRGISSRRVTRPTKEQLQLDMQQLPMVHIGAKYGVSDNAARKWAKQYGLLS